MRQSLVCQSAKALKNIVKTKASRAARAIPPTTEYVEFDNKDGSRPFTLPRTLSSGSNLRENTQKSLEALLKSPGSLYQKVWESYVTLKEIVDKQPGPPIPRHILEAVLRQCIPSWVALRNNAIAPTTEYGARKRLQSPLPHEARLRSILQYMRKSNQLPTRDDLNFILQQMSAVGHVNGATAVLDEMEANGIQPSFTTFKYILRACVFRLETSVPPDAGSQVADAVVALTSRVVRRMQELNMELERSIVELILRVFREQENTEAVEHILRLACAFDIHRPDRIPDEFAKRLVEADERKAPLPVPLPVTTSMLTTMMILYGSKGETAKMITAFEVLTNPYPLPSNLPSPQSDWWDAEDEYDVANPVIQTPLKHRPEYVWEPPRSTPNTATFTYMIRHLAWAKQRMLCEHYMMVAEEYDKAESVRLRKELTKELKRLENLSINDNPDRLPEDATILQGLSFIEAPRFQVTDLMFKPVFIYANQARLTELMRWMRQHLRVLIWRRENDLDFFKKSYEILPPPTIPPGVEVRLNTRHQLYVDYREIAKGPETPKPLDLHFHIQFVESTLTGLVSLLERADEAVARLSQRTQEMMTRRVWKDQDVFLSDVGHRTLIGRDEWGERVKWKEWKGPVTAANLDRWKPSPSTEGAVVPSRWMDSRLAAKSRAIESDRDEESPDTPK